MLKPIWNRIHSFRCIYVFLFSVTHSHAAKNWKSLNHKISYDKEKIGPTKYPRKNIWNDEIPTRKMLDPRNTHEKNFGPTKYPREETWTYQISPRKNFGPTKYPREKTLDRQNTLEKKLWTDEIPTRKNFGPTKHQREKISDPRNTNEKKFLTQEIPTRKNFGPTKFPRRHDGTFALDPRDPLWHVTYEI